MKPATQYTLRSIAFLAIYALLLNQFAYAQDPGMQAAQAAQQAAQQASQQAQQNMATAQAAAAQATAANAQALDNTQSTPAPVQQAPEFPTPASGPVPAQIAAAHTILLTNVGAASTFPINSTQAFNDIFADLQAWGHFQMAASPAQADLIFQLRDIAPITDVSGGRGGVYTTNSPAFQLTIRDAKTNVALWTITSPVILSYKKKELDHWTALSERNLISRIKVLVGDPLQPSETADLTTYPKTHNAALAWILVGSVVGLAVAGGLVIRHESNDSLANMKASQDAFCNANHIPLSECEGG